MSSRHSPSSPSCASTTSSSSSTFFVCVHCNTPCGESALYRYLTPNSTASIKLTLCSNSHCRMVADPYLEREYLLVAMDWVLLRPPAYRHVLCNQLQLKIMERHDVDSNIKEESAVLLQPMLLLRGMTIFGGIPSAVLEAYLQWSVALSLPSQSQYFISEFSNETVWWALQLVVMAWLGRIIVWWTTCKLIRTTNPPAVVNTNSQNNVVSSQQEHNYLAVQLYMAWLLPTAFYAVTVMVTIWENTQTVMSLTSFLVTAMQFTTLSSLFLSSPKQRRAMVAFVIGLLIPVVWKLLLALLIPGWKPVPCLLWSLPPIEPWTNRWQWWEHVCLM